MAIADERVVGVPPKDAVGQVAASCQSRPGGCKYQSWLDGKLLQGHLYSTECLETYSDV